MSILSKQIYNKNTTSIKFIVLNIWLIHLIKLDLIKERIKHMGKRIKERNSRVAVISGVEWRSPYSCSCIPLSPLFLHHRLRLINTTKIDLQLAVVWDKWWGKVRWKTVKEASPRMTRRRWRELSRRCMCRHGRTRSPSERCSLVSFWALSSMSLFASSISPPVLFPRWTSRRGSSASPPSRRGQWWSRSAAFSSIPSPGRRIPWFKPASSPLPALLLAVSVINKIDLGFCQIGGNDLNFAGGTASYLLAMSPITASQAEQGNTPNNVKQLRLGWMIAFVFAVSFVGLFSIMPLRRVCSHAKSILTQIIANWS